MKIHLYLLKLLSSLFANSGDPDQMSHSVVSDLSLQSLPITFLGISRFLRPCLGHSMIKNWWNLPISNPQPDLHNINAHTKFDENPLIFTELSGNENTGMSRPDNFAYLQSQIRSPQHQCIYQIWRKAIDIYSSYENKDGQTYDRWMDILTGQMLWGYPFDLSFIFFNLAKQFNLIMMK